MRRFRLKSPIGYPGWSRTKIYNENHQAIYTDVIVIDLVRDYPDDWEEVFDTIAPTTESEKSKFVISYISKDGLIVLNNIVDADSFQEAIDIIKGDEGVRAILSCYKS